MNKFFVRFWPVGFIIALCLLFSAPYVVKGRIPFPSTYLVTFFAPWSATHGMPVKNNAMPDVITQIYPWKRVTVDALRHGELALWNPYSFSGTSHIGNYQSAVLSPVNILFLLLPEKHAWSIMILLQPLLAGIFMFLFLRRLTVKKTGALLGAVAFMFCGFITVWMAYGTLGYAVLYLPLVLYGIHRFMDNGSRLGGGAAVIGLTLSFLSGHFQMSTYVLLYAVSFVIFLYLCHKNAARTGRMILLILCALGLSAAQILTGFAAYGQAVRSSLFLKGEVIPWQYIVTLFSPDFYGNPVTRNDWFGHYAEWAGYVGVAPLLLAFFALIAKWRPRVSLYFALMSAITLCLAFQTPLVDLLFALKIPVLSTSSASRIIVLMSFSLSILAGMGLDAIVESWNAKNKKQIIRWGLGIGFVILCVWTVLYFARPLPAEKLSVAMRNTILPSLFAVMTLLTAVIGLWMPKKIRLILPFLFIIITGVDMLRFSAKWMPFDPVDLVYPHIPVIKKLQTLVQPGQARVFGNIGNEVGSAFGIPLIEGYDAVYQYRYGKLITAVTAGKVRQVDRSVVVFDKKGQYSEAMLQLLGVRYYAHKKSDGRLPWAYPFWEFPQYNRIWEDENFEILENTESMPRAFLASSYVVRNTEQEILEALFAKDIDRSNTIVLETEPEFSPATGSGTATISSYRPNTVVIDVIAEVPKLLFLSDVYDAGWHASVDGVNTKIYRADFAFRAVAVPAGTHTVVMRYMPKGVVWGFTIAGFATLGLAGLLLWKRKN